MRFGRKIAVNRVKFLKGNGRCDITKERDGAPVAIAHDISAFGKCSGQTIARDIHERKGYG